MTKYLREPGNCTECGHALSMVKQKQKYIYYVCHPCRHKEYPGKETTIRSWHLGTKGLTQDWYDNKFAEQNGKCAICKQPPTETVNGKVKNLNIDHDHNCCRVFKEREIFLPCKKC